MKKYYRVKDVAERLGMGVSTVWLRTKETRDMLSQGMITTNDDLFPLPIKLSDKVTVWALEDLERWEAGKKNI